MSCNWSLEILPAKGERPFLAACLRAEQQAKGSTRRGALTFASRQTPSSARSRARQPKAGTTDLSG